jgi:hypothetical protein
LRGVIVPDAGALWFEVAAAVPKNALRALSNESSDFTLVCFIWAY